MIAHHEFEHSAVGPNLDLIDAHREAERRIEEVTRAEAERLTDLGIFFRGVLITKASNSREGMRWTLRDRLFFLREALTP